MAHYSPDSRCHATLETRSDLLVTSMCHRGIHAENACSCALVAFNCARICLAFTQPLPYDADSLVSYLATRDAINAILAASVQDTVVQQVPFVKATLGFICRSPVSPPEKMDASLRAVASALIKNGSVGSAVISHAAGTFALICTTSTAGVSTCSIFDPHSSDGATFFFFDSVRATTEVLISYLGAGSDSPPTSSSSTRRSVQPPQPHLADELGIYVFAPTNPSAADLALLVQSSILQGIEIAALRAELARYMESSKLRLARKKEGKRLAMEDCALGLEFEAGQQLNDADNAGPPPDACGPGTPSYANTLPVEEDTGGKRRAPATPPRPRCSASHPRNT
ncbi:hypothetical protein B0H11DRAFT_1947724 [Mycena galericulata]|nr:hypothetical protein B0H11DRAFT_1947724 [Mycena galericulata]